MLSMRHASAVALIVVAIPAPANAQGAFQTLQLTEEPACTGCTISIEPVATLRGGEEYGGASGTNYLLRDSRGRYIMSSIFDQSTLLVYGPDGQFQRALGRAGGGPDEFQQIAFATLGPGDSIHVFDAEARARTVYTPDLEFVRRSNLGIRPSRGIVLTPDTTILVGTIATRSHFGFGVHAVVNDRLDRPLGTMEPLGDNGRPLASLNRRAATDGHGGFWTADFDAFVLDGFGPSGRQHSRVAGEPAWFEQADPQTPEGRLNPRIRDLQIDEQGLLWLTCSIPARDWRANIEVYDLPGAPGGFNLRSRTGNLDDLYDTILAVIDPTDGRLLAAHRMDTVVSGFADRSHIYAYLESADGEGSIQIWRVRFHQPGGTDDGGRMLPSVPPAAGAGVLLFLGLALAWWSLKRIRSSRI
ncbi:MAG: hypothetical protein WEA24_01180 [Gemmatimonadota bacterium]